jgi:hypothetical protein
MNQYCKNITFSVIPEQKPSHIDANYWAKAKGTAILCGYPNNTGELVITAQTLCNDIGLRINDTYQFSGN